jgi:K+-transporting ATPase ATPase C chain
MLAIWTILTGLAYPLLVTGLARVVFPRQAAGSLIVEEGGPVGSALIGQPFDDARYFWGRPSATTPEFDAAASGGSNWGPMNPELHARIASHTASLGDSRPDGSIPVDLVTASGSGLDPHITTAGARYQVSRVATARGLEMAVVQQLVERYREERQFGFLGEPRVNVLELNLALDSLSGAREPTRP